MSCGYTGRNANLAFKKETGWGTYIAPDIKLRASTESLSKTVNYIEDGALVGEAFTTDMIKSSSNSGGGLETKLHPDTAGIMLHWVLGGESGVADPPNSYLIINYTGASAYARLSLVGTNLTAELSADGTTYAADANFGTTGVYDLTAAAQDTTAELAALIAADTGWECSYVGAGAGVTASIAAFAATHVVHNSDKVGAMVLGTLVTSTVAKAHTVFPAATTTCLPSYTVQVNRTLGTNKSLAYTGSKLGQLSLNISAGELNGASLTLSSKDELVDQNDVTVATPIIQSYSALKTRVFLDNIEVTVAKQFSININNSLDESFVIGSEFILEQERQSATIDFSGSVNLVTPATDVYSKRTNYTGDIPSEIIVYMEAVDNADVANAVPFSVIIRLPRCKFTDFNAPISGPDRIVINMTGQAVKPKLTYKHIECKIVDQDVTVY